MKQPWHNMTKGPSVRQRQSAQAFSLVELLVCIAIGLLLILGVNQVFSTTAATVGTGQALATANRDDRAFDTVVRNDVRAAVIAPQTCFLIRSSRTYAFRNFNDALNDADGKPETIDGTDGTVPAAAINDRSHRIDQLAFFITGAFSRQTVSGTLGGSSLTSDEAWVNYGHLALPGNAALTANSKAINSAWPDGSFFSPAEPDHANGIRNDNNRYASDWILGRVSILASPTAARWDKQCYMPGRGQWPALAPLAAGSTTPDGSAIESLRYDVAAISIADFRLQLSSFAAPGASNWYDPLINYRFQANPFVLHRPVTPADVAKAAPVLLRCCSQFIVEYAGDYVVQEYGYLVGPSSFTPNPIIVANGTDGDLDYVVINGQRQIRWYGLPRDTNGNGVIDPNEGDVVPLRDVRIGHSPADFERFVDLAYSTNHATETNADSVYTCAWGPDTTSTPPKLLRITIALDDPNGRLRQPQMFQYVIDLQP